MKHNILSLTELELIRDDFTDRFKSLKRDYYRAFTEKIEFTHNLGTGSAPFPITLYCMSQLDFFSGAFFGHSKTKNKLRQTDRMSLFLERYCHYDLDLSRMALDIFRHKLVHLGMPCVSKPNQNKGIQGWQISSIESKDCHWSIVTQDVHGNKFFRFGIKNFICHLETGVMGKNGYFDCLYKDSDLQHKYNLLFEEIIKS